LWKIPHGLHLLQLLNAPRQALINDNSLKADLRCRYLLLESFELSFCLVKCQHLASVTMPTLPARSPTTATDSAFLSTTAVASFRGSALADTPVSGVVVPPGYALIDAHVQSVVHLTTQYLPTQYDEDVVLHRRTGTGQRRIALHRHYCLLYFLNVVHIALHCTCSLSF
jgi:hypothetical protein